MKPTRLCLPLALLGLSAAGPASASPAAVPTSAALLQEGDFRTVFMDALRLNAKSEMVRLVRARTPEAIEAVVAVCEAISDGSNEDLEAEIEGLRTSWKEAMNTEFVELEYEYFSLLRPEVKTARSQLRTRFNLEYRRLQEAMAAKDKGTLQGIGLELLGFGDAFEEMGDHYLASQCYINAGICFDKDQRGEDADLPHACEAFGKGAKARHAVQLLDRIYEDTKIRYEALEAEGYGAGGSGAVEAAPAPEAAENSSAITVPLTFEVFPDLETVRRPHYLIDPVYQIWTGIYMARTGSEGVLTSMQQGAPKVKREGDSKALIDSNADGTPDLDLPLTGKITPVQIEIGEGAEKRSWAFLATIGQAQDTYQGLRFNLGPGDESLAVYVSPAASMVGTLGATTIRVLDDNMDGIYGSPPLEWGHVGTIEGSYQRDVDSILVGESKAAQPWSELVAVGGSWYKLEPQRAGTELLATPMTVQTGTLVLDLKGAKVDWLVVRGDAEVNSKHFFEIAQGGKTGVQVPVGRYRLYSGQVSQGSKNQMMKAFILPGTNTRTWNVEAGGKLVMELGEPFGLDFRVVQDDEKVKVVGASVVVTGRGAETYQRLWNCVVQPEVNSREAGKKKADKQGKMRAAESQDQVNQDFNNDYKTIWFPIDYEFPKKQAGEAVEIQLFEKKNKLFGKLESDWKG